MLRESNCDDADTQAQRDDNCHFFATGLRIADTPTGEPLVRARCEARTRGRCVGRADCGRLEECVGIGECAVSGAICTSDAGCVSVPGDRCTLVGLCRDARPVCYWNVEVDRVEMMPSGLEVVIAEDDLDPSLLALTMYNPAVRGALCRPAVVPDFEPLGVASGVLGPAPGATP